MVVLIADRISKLRSFRPAVESDTSRSPFPRVTIRVTKRRSVPNNAFLEVSLAVISVKKFISLKRTILIRFTLLINIIPYDSDYEYYIYSYHYKLTDM